MLGLSKVLQALPSDKLELFEITLAIRIRPFFENQSNNLREAAILLFGDLCHKTQTKDKNPNIDDENKTSGTSTSTSDSMREQLLLNLFSLLLHLCESNTSITKVCSQHLISN